MFSRWEGSLVQISRGRFEGLLQAVRGEQVRAYLVRANQAIVARGRDAARTVHLTLVIPECTRCLWQGRQLDAGCLVVHDHEIEVSHRSSKPAAYLTLTVDNDAFHQAVLALTWADPVPLGWQALQPPPESYERLHATLCRFLASADLMNVAHHEACEIEQACLAAAVEAVFETGGRRVELPCPARAALLRRAEDLMRAQLRTPIGEVDLCAALGVTGRTLRLAFRERYGMGPMAYYQTLRLHAARAALKEGGPGAGSVAEVGRRFGFANLGKFAGYYRRQFGELPSETVSRRSGSSPHPSGH
jgi:AraC-like DNA-binding protein